MRTSTIISILFAVFLVIGCTTTGNVVKIDTVTEPEQEVKEESVVTEPIQEIQAEEPAAEPVQEEKLVTRTAKVIKTRLTGYVIRLENPIVERVYYNDDLELEVGDRLQFEEDSQNNMLNVRKIGESKGY
ncbi:MAG TPA: hypothetical protein VJB94_00945 [Candidatus Nanoarchaeia archaeon]|nr:hypothetical protein [Candidatus Nanoarchaeia archaeon]